MRKKRYFIRRMKKRSTRHEARREVPQGKDTKHTHADSREEIIQDSAATKRGKAYRLPRISAALRQLRKSYSQDARPENEAADSGVENTVMVSEKALGGAVKTFRRGVREMRHTTREKEKSHSSPKDNESAGSLGSPSNPQSDNAAKDNIRHERKKETIRQYQNKDTLPKEKPPTLVRETDMENRFLSFLPEDTPKSAKEQGAMSGKKYAADKTMYDTAQRQREEVAVAHTNGKHRAARQTVISRQTVLSQENALVKEKSRPKNKGVSSIKNSRKSPKVIKKTIKDGQRTIKTAQQAAHTTRKAVQKARKTAMRLRYVAIRIQKTAKFAAKISVKVMAALLKMLAAAAKALMAAVAAGGWIVVVIIAVVALLIALVSSPLGIFFSENDAQNPPISQIVREIDAEYNRAIQDIIDRNPTDTIIYDGEGDGGVGGRWLDIVPVFAVQTTSDAENGMDVATLDDTRQRMLRNVFWDMVEIRHRVGSDAVTNEETLEDGSVVTNTTTTTKLVITTTVKSPENQSDDYGFDAQKDGMLEQMLSPESQKMLMDLLGIDDLTGLTPEQLLAIYSNLPPGEIGSEVVKFALSRLGDRYSTRDCSAFTRWVYSQFDVSLPRTAAEQAKFCADKGLAVAKKDLQPGDLIFFSHFTNGRYLDITHVGIYTGNNMICDSSSSRGKVVHRKLYSGIVLCGRPQLLYNGG